MFIGIDVGSRHLEVAATETAPALPRRVPNTTEGIARLVAVLAEIGPELVVLEATGNYHRPLLAAVLVAAVPVAVVNPAQLAAFRTTRLGRHKTDRADAQLLARFAALHQAELRRATVDEPTLAQLRELVAYHDDLVVQRTAARNRHHAATWAGEVRVVRWLEADLAALEARLAEVNQTIAQLVATRPETAVLTAQAGVGMLTAAAILAYLPTGVLGNPKAAAAYAGVHPRQEQSGQRSRSRLSKQGSPALRRYLYLAAMTAIRFDPELKAWYEGLCARGKTAPCALGAVAHKLLRRLMGRIRDARQESRPVSLPLAA